MTVEAQSLTSITTIAAEPPTTCGTSLPNFPLTLYIVRVPGSRDVFLSPLKPNDRVVHAHDVQSSLYYLHVNDADDQTVQGSPSLTSMAPLQPKVARKAVPDTAARRPLPTPPASPDSASGWPSNGHGPYSHVPRRRPVLPAREQEFGEDRYSIDSNRSRPDSSVEALRLQTMTLIRRDPSTSEQCNVATISDPPVDEVSSATSQTTIDSIGRAKNAGAPLFVHVSSAGYSRFVDPRKDSTYDQHSSPSTAPYMFRRRLWMDASRHANHTYVDRRPTSTALLFVSAASDVSLHALPSRPGYDRNKGYSFHDPWSNRCDFSTTTTGRALRCRRARQSLSQDPATAFDDISELRFNLPTHHQRSKSDHTSHAPIHTSKRTSVFSTVSSRSHASSSFSGAPHNEGSDDEGADYSLGRERAGGGFAGREPKLGKLIIYPHGLQMIDLVVAANLALWWRAYERCSS